MDCPEKFLLLGLMFFLIVALILLIQTEQDLKKIKILEITAGLSLLIFVPIYTRIIYVSKKYSQAVCINCGGQSWKLKKGNNMGRCPFCDEEKVVVQKWQV